MNSKKVIVGVGEKRESIAKKKREKERKRVIYIYDVMYKKLNK